MILLVPTLYLGSGVINSQNKKYFLQSGLEFKLKFLRIVNVNAKSIRGDLIIKKREYFGHFPKKGGQVKKNPKMSKIQIRTFENPWGGLNFSKMSKFQPKIR